MLRLSPISIDKEDSLKLVCFLKVLDLDLIRVLLYSSNKLTERRLK